MQPVVPQKTVAEMANEGMDQFKSKQVEEAKALLEAAGYKVSPSPAQWKEYSCVVTLRVQSHNFSEKEFARIVGELLKPLVPSLEKFQKLTTRPVVGISNMKFSEGKRVAVKIDDRNDGDARI